MARTTTAARRCDGCGHAFHRDTCPRKGTSGCLPLLDPATGRQTGIACFGTKGPCPCPFGECHTCGAPVAGATPFPLDSGAPETDIDRGSAGAADGLLAVRQLPDGTLACRRLAPGEQPAEGEWRGREHEHQLAAAHPWAFASLVLAGSYTELIWKDKRRRELSSSAFRRRPRWSFRRLGRGASHIITDCTGPLWTLVITGPRRGEWGFWTADAHGRGRFVPWREYTEGSSIPAYAKAKEGRP